MDDFVSRISGRPVASGRCDGVQIYYNFILNAAETGKFPLKADKKVDTILTLYISVLSYELLTYII